MSERHGEIIRQWDVLRDIAGARGCTRKALAARYRVSERTISRDLGVLQEAGFPLLDERVDGAVRWRLAGTPFVALTNTAFNFAELCAFYVNRARMASSGGSPIEADLQSAIAKISAALSPQMRAFLDRLPTVVDWKPDPGPAGGPSEDEPYVRDLVQATLDHRRVAMAYHSFSSRRVKEYVAEPYRLTFGNGGLYLSAHVPAYGQVRTFALQRIRSLRVLEERFSPVQHLPGNPYDNSLGMFTGTPEHVEVEFSARVAPYIEERTWHRSQTTVRRQDGSVVLLLDVANDLPLRSWILGFGPCARVLKPASLARAILEELDEAREQYAPHMPLDVLKGPRRSK